MSVASLTDGQIVPGLLRFCRRLSKCPKGGGGINSALDGLAGITHIGWRWERKKMSTAHIRTSSFLISLLCVSHLIVYLISCACRFSFSPRCAEYQFLSPEINSTHPAEHLLPPPSLSLSSDGAVPIDDSSLSLTARPVTTVALAFLKTESWLLLLLPDPCPCASSTADDGPFGPLNALLSRSFHFFFFSFHFRSFVFFFKRGGTAFQNVNGNLWN